MTHHRLGLLACGLLLFSAAAESQTVELAAELSSEQAGAYSADPDGSGTARLQVSTDEGRLCYQLTVTDIEPTSSAHLHAGQAGRAGPVVLELEAPADGSSESCADLDADLLRGLIESPANFYVDVHNARYPGGALRGQLGSALGL